MCKRHAPDAPSKVVTATISFVRWTVWMATVVKEVVLEFGLLYMFVGLLMALSCSMHDSHMTKAACWQVGLQELTLACEYSRSYECQGFLC